MSPSYSLCLLLFFSARVLGQCFYPNGLLADGDTPCDGDAEHSMCCGKSAGSVCLSNKLCASPDGNIIRGSCTDRDWHAPECASFCLGESLMRVQCRYKALTAFTGAATGGTDLISCSNVTDTDTSFCCDHTVDCCDTGVGRFRVLPSNPEVWARFDRNEETYSVVGTMFTGNPTSSEAEATVTSTSTTASSGTTTEAEPANETSRDANNEQGSKGNDGLSTGARIGIGVGAGLGVLILLLLAIFCWRRRRRPRGNELDANSRNNSQTPHNAGPGPTEKAYNGGLVEAPGVVPPRHYHQHVQELPASPIPAGDPNSRW
jgi:hypothetical protein